MRAGAIRTTAGPLIRIDAGGVSRTDDDRDSSVTNALDAEEIAARRYKNIGIGLSASSWVGSARHPSRTGTSYNRPGANRAQKWRNPGTITLTTGRPTSGRVWSSTIISMSRASTKP